MKYRLLILLMLIPLLASAKPKKKESVSAILSGIVDTAPSTWEKGKTFLFLKEKVDMSLIPEVPDAAFDTLMQKGSVWLYDSMVSEEDWMGQQLLQLRFISPEGRAYRWNTGKGMSVMTDKNYRPSLAMFCPEEQVIKMDEALKSRLLFLNYNDERVVYKTDTIEHQRHQKYVSVHVDSVTVGIERTPFCVHFHNDKGEVGYFYTTLPTDQVVGVSTPINRFLQFGDPYYDYPNISKDIWEKICNSVVSQGMTLEECRLSWGRPSKIERVPTRVGYIEQWTYNDGRVLQFMDGTLSRVGKI